MIHNKPASGQRKQVLVTGGAGFIGSHLVKALIPLNSIERIVVLDNLATGSVDNLPAHAKVEFIQGDLTQQSKLLESTVNVDVVFHLAAQAPSLNSTTDAASKFENKDIGTMCLFEAASINRVKRIVIASTCAVYGESAQAKVTEQDLLKPLSPYAFSKVATESTAEAFSKSTEIESVILRMFNVYGPGQKSDSAYASVIPKFLEAVYSGKDVTIYGDGQQTRDFLHVNDAVQAFCQAGIRYQGIATARIFNVASGKSLSVLELLKMIADISDKSPTIVMAEAREGEIIHSQADTTSAQRFLEFSPKISLRAGLSQLWQSISIAESAKQQLTKSQSIVHLGKS